MMCIVLTSCSSTGELLDSQIIKSGMANTTSNQDYKKLATEGNNFLAGYITVFYNDNNITKNCSFNMNSFSDGILLGETGEVILPTKINTNYLYSIRCAARDSNPYLNYIFDEVPVDVLGSISYFGELEVNFTIVKKEDPNLKYKYSGPWMKSFEYKSTNEKKKALADKYNLTIDSLTKIHLR